MYWLMDDRLTREGKAVLVEMYERGFSAQAIADMVGFKNQVRVLRNLRRAGVAIRSTYDKRFHKQYRGGRVEASEGYWRVWISPDDPLASMRNHHGYALEHRLVMARALGRPLLLTETVHHIDGDKSNNALENLQLRQGKHGKHVVMVCLDCGSHNIGHAKVQ